MTSKQISIGVGVPMMIVGVLMAFLWAPTNLEWIDTIEFVGALIGILGIIFFVSGLLYSKQPVLT